MNLSAISKCSEEQARDYFEKIRWPNGPVCPHCGSVNVVRLQGKAHRPGLFKCRAGNEQFTATVDTILEDSHLSIRTWLMAFAIMSSSKKGVSALQLQRQLGIGSYRSAWHLCHRIRHAMGKEPLKGLLLGVGGGDVAGGKKSHAGRGTNKTPVMVAGRARRPRTRACRPGCDRKDA